MTIFQSMFREFFFICIHILNIFDSLISWNALKSSLLEYIFLFDWLWLFWFLSLCLLGIFLALFGWWLNYWFWLSVRLFVWMILIELDLIDSQLLELNLIFISLNKSLNLRQRVFPIIDNARDTSLNQSLGTTQAWLGCNIHSGPLSLRPTCFDNRIGLGMHT